MALDEDKIQFRTGPGLAARLNDRAKSWGLAVNETSKRLATLSEFELGLDDYAEVAALSVAIGDNGRSFAQAADYFAFRKGRDDA